MKGRINIITLGCSKNLVDSEFLGARLADAGYRVDYDAGINSHNIVVINTCGFIGDAKEESVNTILSYVEAREKGQIERLYVMGCLAQRYKKELQLEIPEVDQFYGVNDMRELLEEMDVDYKKEMIGERKISTPGHYAYLKVSEGCDRSCAFCAIPLIRGRQRSVPIDQLVTEAGKLTGKGVKEILLIAQDLSAYGTDLYKSLKLPELVDRLSAMEAIKWLRLHYLYPLQFSKEILRLMQERNNICRYIDMPLQHISNPLLKRMKRGNNRRQTYDLLHAIRKEVPDVALRSTLLVGFPGETEQEFLELVDFITDIRFDRLGVFTYSHEEQTPAWKNFKDDIPAEVKQERLNYIMEVQQEISRELNYSKVDRQMDVLVDRREGEYFVGRTQYDSPDVDGEVLIRQDAHPEIEPGRFYKTRITNADEYDLFASLVKP